MYRTYEIIEKCQNALRDIRTFYQADIINYRGKTSDSGEYFTEIISKFVCEHIDSFQNDIPCITRKSSYKVSGHDGVFDENSNREEEKIAMKLWKQSDAGHIYNGIGKIIDYQTPLKSHREAVAGKIDLLSYDGKTLHILELKKPDSTETMLRCVLEGYTYMKTSDHAKLIVDFNLPSDTVVKASPFVFVDGEQYKEMQESRPQLKRLIELLDCKPFYIKEIKNVYEVEE